MLVPASSGRNINKLLPLVYIVASADLFRPLVLSSLRARMRQVAAPLALLAHKWAATRVRTASTCRAYLLALNARRDRIVLRGRILFQLLPHRRFMPVRMLCRVYLVMPVLRPLCLGKSNGHRKSK
jgi:hypothetical protein